MNKILGTLKKDYFALTEKVGNYFYWCKYLFSSQPVWNCIHCHGCGEEECVGSRHLGITLQLQSKPYVLLFEVAQYYLYNLIG